MRVFLLGTETTYYSVGPNLMALGTIYCHLQVLASSNQKTVLTIVYLKRQLEFGGRLHKLKYSTSTNVCMPWGYPSVGSRPDFSKQAGLLIRVGQKGKGSSFPCKWFKYGSQSQTSQKKHSQGLDSLPSEHSPAASGMGRELRNSLHRWPSAASSAAHGEAHRMIKALPGQHEGWVSKANWLLIFK